MFFISAYPSVEVIFESAAYLYQSCGDGRGNEVALYHFVKVGEGDPSCAAGLALLKDDVPYIDVLSDNIAVADRGASGSRFRERKARPPPPLSRSPRKALSQRPVLMSLPQEENRRCFPRGQASRAFRANRRVMRISFLSFTVHIPTAIWYVPRRILVPLTWVRPSGIAFYVIQIPEFLHWVVPSVNSMNVFCILSHCGGFFNSFCGIGRKPVKNF